MIKQPYWFYFLKLVLLVVFQTCDLVLISTSDCKEFGSGDNSESQNRLKKIQLLLCTLQILSQLACFTVIFSLLCDTFPFQIGLIGVLTKRFWRMLSLHGIYFILTIIVSSVRVMNLYDGKTMIDIWMMGSYTFFSFVHKIGK